MTNFLVTGQPDWWHVFWVLATWSAAYMIAAVILREVFSKPQTPMEKYGLWFGRIVGIVGASIIFAYGYRTTGELDRAERECEHYKALAAQNKANGVSEILQGPHSTVSITTQKGTDIQIRNIDNDRRKSSRSVFGTTERQGCETNQHRAEDGSDWGLGGSDCYRSGRTGGIGRDSYGVSIRAPGICPTTDGTTTVY